MDEQALCGSFLWSHRRFDPHCFSSVREKQSRCIGCILLGWNIKSSATVAETLWRGQTARFGGNKNAFRLVYSVTATILIDREWCCLYRRTLGCLAWSSCPLRRGSPRCSPGPCHRPQASLGTTPHLLNLWSLHCIQLQHNRGWRKTSC